MSIHVLLFSPITLSNLLFYFCVSSFFPNLLMFLKRFERLPVYSNIEHLFYYFYGKHPAEKANPQYRRVPSPLIITWYQYVIHALPSLSEHFLALDELCDWLIKFVQRELANQSKVLIKVLITDGQMVLTQDLFQSLSILCYSFQCFFQKTKIISSF